MAAGMVGALIGTLPWYWAGRALGADRLTRWAGRHGRWLTMAPADIDDAQHWFERHGARAVFLGRMVPGVRSVISVPAGIAYMPLWRFLLWSFAGSSLWAGALVGLGYVLEGQYERIAHWLDPVTKVVLGAAVLAYVYRVLTFKRRSNST